MLEIEIVYFRYPGMQLIGLFIKRQDFCLTQATELKCLMILQWKAVGN